MTLSSNETQCVTPPANLVSWWPGDGNAIDIQGNNNGTLRNGAGFGTGEVGQAFSLNGNNQDVEIGDPASLKLTTGMTIDAWVYPTSTPGGLVGVLTKWNQDASIDSTADSYALFLNGAQLQSYVHQSDGGEPSVLGGNVPVNTWTHVAATYDAASGVFTAYVNGVAVNSATLGSLNILATDAPVDLGSEADDGSGRYFPGLIDEVEIFNRALTAGEVAAIYNAGSAGKCKSVLLYVSNDNNTIEKFDASGNDLGTFASSGLNIPQGLAFDVSGNLYAANLGTSSIEKFDGTGNDLGAFASSGLDRPAGLAFDASGNLYAANSNPNVNTIEKFGANGADQGAFANSGLSQPIGLAFDFKGNLYAANAGNSTIEKFNPGGTGTPFVNSGLSGPEGLAFDTSGNLYAVNGSGFSIKKFDSNGNVTVFANSGLNEAVSLAFDTNGNLYVANNGNNTIEKFDLTETGRSLQIRA